MSRLPIQPVASATGSNAEIFAALQKGLGTVPNMARVMANSPAVLQSWAQFNGAMGGSRLAAPIREQIALATAEANDCGYCLAAHSALGKLAGLAPQQIDDARRGESSDPRTQAALSFTRSLIRTQGGVGADELDELRAAGFDDDEIAEIVGSVALNLFTNFFNRAFDVDIDFPRVPALAAAAN